MANLLTGIGRGLLAIASLVPRMWNAMLAAASVRFWAMVGAAIALSAFAAWLVWIIWRGGWPVSIAPRQVDILGWALFIVLFGVILVVIALTGKHVEANGVWGRIDVSGGDDPAAPPAVTVTTKIEPGDKAP